MYVYDIFIKYLTHNNKKLSIPTIIIDRPFIIFIYFILV